MTETSQHTPPGPQPPEPPGGTGGTGGPVGGPGGPGGPAGGPGGGPVGGPGGGPVPGWDGDRLRDFRTMRRSRVDRKLKGVCGGLARHLDVDPTVVRVLFVVLVFFGGTALFVYLALWLFVPDEWTGRAVIQTGDSSRNLLLIALGVLAGVLVVGDAFSGNTFPWPLAVLAVVVAAILMSRDRRARSAPPPGHQPAYPGGYAATDPAGYSGLPGDQSSYRASYQPASPPSYDAPAVGGGAATFAAGGTAPPAWYPPVPAPMPTRPRRTGPLLFLPTLALVALAVGALGLYDASQGGVVDAAYPALALACIGSMLVLGSVFGRPGGLIAAGVLASLVLGVTAVSEPTFEGDRDLVARPRSASDLQATYTVPAGSLLLDLSRVRDLETLEGRSVALSMNAGEIVVIVPEGVPVDLEADIAYGGLIETPLGDRDGWGNHLSGVLGGASGAEPLTVDIDLDMGHIELRRA